SKDKTVAQTATLLKLSTLALEQILWDTLSDKAKVQLLHYKLNTITPAQFAVYKSKLRDDEQLVYLSLDYIQQLNSKQQYTEAMTVWNLMPKSEKIDEHIIAAANK